MGISGSEALLKSSIEHSTKHSLEEYLCHTFLHQVDPVFKILHRPSLCSFLLEGRPYLHYDLGHPASEALKSAVYYAAACSTSDEQWPSNFVVSRKSAIAKYRRETDIGLSRADFINTDDLTVLQAFVLSLVPILIRHPLQEIITKTGQHSISRSKSTNMDHA